MIARGLSLADNIEIMARLTNAIREERDARN